MNCRFDLLNESWYKIHGDKVLKEAFIKENILWIDDYINSLYNENYNVSDELEKKYNFSLKIVDYNDDNLFITSGIYNQETDKITLNITKDAIDYIDNKEENIKQFIIEEMKIAFIHENTHRQQNKGNYKNQKYFNLPENFSMNDMIKYLAQFQEISAMARGVAQEIENSYDEPKKNLDNIFKEYRNKVNSLFSDQAKMIIYIYKERLKGKWWKTFINHVYQYLS